MKISNFQKIDNMYAYAVNMISKLNVYLHYSTRVLLFYSWKFLKIFQTLSFYTIYTAFSILTLLLQHYQLLHEKQVMYFNQQHSALEVCFANIV